ncbi:unnamed protein product [Urochloa humidicola]
MGVRGTSLRFGWLHAGLPPPCASTKIFPAGRAVRVGRLRGVPCQKSSRDTLFEAALPANSSSGSCKAPAVRRHAHVAVAFPLLSGQVWPFPLSVILLQFSSHGSA